MPTFASRMMLASVVGEFSLAQWSHDASSSSSNAPSRIARGEAFVRVHIKGEVSSPDIESNLIVRRKCRGEKCANIKNNKLLDD